MEDAKIKWNFFRPDEGEDQYGNFYYRTDCIWVVVWAYVKIILAIASLWTIIILLK